jgi:hypothetical protein
VLEDPFVGDDIGASGVRDKISGVVGDRGRKFFFYDVAPIWIDEDGVDGGGHQ